MEGDNKEEETKKDDKSPRGKAVEVREEVIDPFIKAEEMIIRLR